ncbi:acyltransferase family protein [Acetobacter conturbans]|nr:acyltransferase [Acetobacter conturbans]
MFASRPAAGSVRFEALQSLRGLAALTVVIRHVLACYPIPDHLTTVIVFFFFNSPAAVTLFFVLSGFVLTHSLERQSLTLPTLLTFWTRRVFRILPCVMAVSLLSYLYIRSPLSAWPIEGSDPFMTGLLPHDMPLSPFLFLKCMLSLSGALVPQNWTVMVELIAALFFPFLWVASTKGARAFLPLAIVTLLLAAFAPAGGKGLPFIYAFSFVAGMVAYRAWQNTTVTLTGVGLLLAAVGMSLPTTVLTEPETLGAVFSSPRLVIPEAVFSALLLFGLARGGAVARALSCRPLLWLGNISYSIYLLHFLIIAIAGRLLSPLLPNLSMTAREGLVLGLTLILVLPLSHLLYETVEKPVNRLGHRVASLLFKPRSHTA